jgi:hypothetical protein
MLLSGKEGKGKGACHGPRRSGPRAGRGLPQGLSDAKGVPGQSRGARADGGGRRRVARRAQGPEERNRAGLPEVTPQKWEKGKGWGWVWGDDDQLGNLNELGPDLTKKALSLVKEGRVYDLGLTYKRSSYKFAGHNPGEIISFRTPTGMLNQKDLDFVRSEEDNSLNTTFTSNALFISDNVATQIDSLGHIFEGDPPHAYNGHRYEDIQSDWGLLKMGAETIPPIVAPATMIDVAKSAGEDPLPESYAIGPTGSRRRWTSRAWT